MVHPTDAQIDEAIKTLKKVIEAAENSNHAGEVALMKAYAAINRRDDKTLTKEKIERIAAAARLAPQQEFSHAGTVVMPNSDSWQSGVRIDGDLIIEITHERSGVAAALAQFISAANPKDVLKLCDIALSGGSGVLS